MAEREVWYEAATRAIVARIRASAASSSVSGTTPPGGVARGVVLFVGDGMGMSTLTAARILSGQRHGSTGEEAQLAWDSFPAVALARVSFSFSAFSTFLYLLLSLSLCPSFLPYLLPFFRRSRFTFVFPFFRSLVFERIYLSPSIPPSAPTLDPLRRMQRASRKCFSLERDPAYITIEPSSSRERS